MRTAGTFNQDTPQSDGQIFLSPGFDLLATVGAPTFSVGANGPIYTLGTAATAYTLVAEISQILRTGVLATFNGPGQQAFGTAGSVPGPSSVTGTSGPSGLVGYPPILGANLATVKGPTVGAIPKGIQINSIDVIYNVTTAALTLATVGISKTSFTNNAAPTTTALLTLANNGLPTAVQANPYVKNIVLPNPSMITTADTNVFLTLNLTSGAGSTTGIVYGIVLRVSYNYN